ncbi:MAG: alkaline phosphatase family protein [Actinobacteria bacterium]|nr:alkaline phosphatase family protein [Actinomycetota bacterium]
MGASEDLASACQRAGLSWPSRRRSGLVDVLAGASGALGLDDERARQACVQLEIPHVDRMVVVLVDGLGRHNLAERAGHAPFLRGLLPGSQTLRSTFPSTTATAMGTFGTGLMPGGTGMLGYTVRVPSTGVLGNLVSWTDLPDPEAWQPSPTWFGRLSAAGIAVTSVGPQWFEGSGLTRAALRGGGYRPAETLSQRVDGVLESLRAPGLAYLYWGDVDKAGHHHGWGSRQWGDEVAAVDAELSRLARSVPRGTLLLVTADHGMVDVDLRARWDVATDPGLRAGVALVAGEPRAMQLHLEPGVDPAEVVERWSHVLGNRAVVVTRQTAVAAGLFGDLDERVRPVVGDVVVAMAGRATVVDSRTQTPGSMELVGVHGSLTDQEMSVPLLLAQG